MSMTILPGSAATLNEMKGHEFVPHEGEGLVYLKLVFLKPDTIKNSDLAQVVDDANSVILCGRLTEIRDQVTKWFNESIETYKE